MDGVKPPREDEGSEKNMIEQVQDSVSKDTNKSWRLDFHLHSLIMQLGCVVVLLTGADYTCESYRVFFMYGPKVIAYFSKNMCASDFLGLPGAHQMWSIW